MPQTSQTCEGATDKLSQVRAEPKSPRNTATHVQPVYELKHVSPLAGGQRLLVLAQHIGHLFEGQTKFAGVDELGDQRDVLSR